MSDLLEYEIYPKLNASLVFGDLTGFKRDGKSFRANCPACGDEKRHFYMYDNQVHGYCFKCDHRVTYWDYTKETKNLSQAETFKELARLADVTLPQSYKMDPAEIQKRQEKADTLEGFINVCKKELKKNKEAQNYLKSRGFTLDEALSLDMGYYPAVDVIKTSLTNNTNKALLYPKWEKRIVGLWRNRAGQPITVWGRTIKTEKTDTDLKYYYLSGESKHSPYGLDRCPGAEVTAVEGLLDALSLLKSGITGVIAVGGKHFTAEQIKSLSKARIKAVTLNFDNDPDGEDGTERAINKLEAEGVKTYVIDPALMVGCKDPDEYIRKNGQAAYNSLLDKAQRGIEWIIERLAKRHDISTSKGKDTVLSEGTGLLNKVQDAIIFDYGIKKLSATLKVPLPAITEICENTKEKQAREDLKREYSSLLNEAQAKIINGDIDATEALLDEGLFTLKARRTTEKIEFFNMDKLYQEGKAYAQKGKETGIKELDRVVKIMPKELIIIGARVRHGKSSLAYNLLLNFLEGNKDEAFIFFNMDVPSTIVMTRLATIWAKKHKNKSLAYKGLLPLFQNPDNFPQEIKDAFFEFHQYGDTKRLAIVNTPQYTVEQLIGHAERLSKEKPLGAIFIDYIELIKTATKQDTEELRIAYIVNQLRIASERLSTPIIALAQMNRGAAKEKTPEKRRPTLEGLRYSGRQEQEATTVLGLFNQSQEKIDINQEEGIFDPSGSETVLEVIPLKNRGGQSNKIIELTFDMVSGHIKSKERTVFDS